MDDVAITDYEGDRIQVGLSTHGRVVVATMDSHAVALSVDEAEQLIELIQTAVKTARETQPAAAAPEKP